MKKILTQYVVCARAGRPDVAVGAGAVGRNTGSLRKRYRNAFRQIHRTRVRYVGQVRLEARQGDGSVAMTPNSMREYLAAHAPELTVVELTELEMFLGKPICSV
jgi:hypothetical protein